MAAAGCTASAAASARTCSWGFEVGGGVEAGGQGLFETGGWRLIGFGSLGVTGLPVAAGCNIDQLAIGQLQGHFTAQCGEYLFTLEHSLAFENLPLEAVDGDGKYLTYKAFNDGDDSAHRYGSVYSCVIFVVASNAFNSNSERRSDNILSPLNWLIPFWN